MPVRWLEDLLPARPNQRPWQQPAWRIAAAAPVQPRAAATAAHPMRVHGKPVPQQPADAAGGRAAPPSFRERTTDGCEDCWMGADANGSGQGGQDGQQGQDNGEAGQGEAGMVASSAGPAAADGGDAEAIAALLPKGDCSGIFEVQLPDGEVLGVAVDAGPASVAYHLQPAAKGLAERLRGQQRELRGHLERRIGRGVTLTIL
jgi:hypothetical protein